MASSNKRRSRKSILGRNEGKSILVPHLDDMIVGLNDGMEHFLKVPATQMAHYRKRTKANMLNDHIVECLVSQFDKTPGVKIDEEHDSAFFIFDGRLALRVKKIDDSDSTRNIRTKRQQEVDFQQLEIAGIESLTYVSFGYKPDETLTRILKAKVLCKYGASTEWVIDVIEGEQATTPLLKIDNSQFDNGVGIRSTRKKSSEEGA